MYQVVGVALYPFHWWSWFSVGVQKWFRTFLRMEYVWIHSWLNGRMIDYGVVFFLWEKETGWQKKQEICLYSDGLMNKKDMFF